MYSALLLLCIINMVKNTFFYGITHGPHSNTAVIVSVSTQEKSSVLFPSNKYQIKSFFSFLPPFPEWTPLCFPSVPDAHVSVSPWISLWKWRLGDHSRAGAWLLSGPCARRHFLPLQTVFWAPTAGPHAVASWRDVVHIRNKNDYSTQHRVERGWR